MIEGAGAGIKALQDKGKRFVYSSNNAARTEDKYVAKFAESEIKATFVSSIKFCISLYRLGSVKVGNPSAGPLRNYNCKIDPPPIRFCYGMNQGINPQCQINLTTQCIFLSRKY